MSNNKKYYFMKIKDDFLDRDDIKWLMSEPDGPQYVCLYLALCIRSLRHEGKLIQQVGSDEIPYDVHGLSRLTGMPPSVVEAGMHRLIRAQLVEILPPTEAMMTGAFYISHYESMVGSETDSAIRMRKMRQNRQAATRMQKMRARKKEALLPDNVVKNT